MALRLKEKEQVISKLKKVAQNAFSVVLADFTGISVSQMTEMRKEGLENQVHIFVLHNRLTKRALLDTPFAFLSEQLKGPCICAFSMSHPRSGAKLFQEKMKKGKDSVVKGAAYEGEWLPANKVTWLASLPTKDEALGKLLGILKELAGGKVARVIAARRDQLQELA